MTTTASAPTVNRNDHVAEWRGTGLQSPARGFEPRRGLSKNSAGFIRKAVRGSILSTLLDSTCGDLG